MKNVFKWMVVGGFIASSASLAAEASAGGASRSSADGTSRSPNILLIISDDQGYGDFGFTGNDLVQTPNLDQLSEQSAFYTDFIVAPACSPSRSALLTGRNHLDVGVWGVGPRGDVRRDEVLMPSFFNPSGYSTWLFGKWDGAKMMELGPVERGFDWFCGIGGGYLQKRPLLCYPDRGEWTDGWSAELITDEAIRKINEAGDTPWLAYMAYIIPHTPWECPDSYADIYRKKSCSELLSQCYGSITQMDHEIGRLLEAVRAAGQEENTVVLFLSDNGPTEDRPAWVNDNYKHAQNSEDWKKRNPLDLTGHKAEVWDAGIRSPLLVRWPGNIDPGEKNDLSRKMPERTEAMAQRCRARWDDIASRNRTFPMRQLKIDNADRWSKAYTLFASRALHFEGDMQSVFYGGARGFSHPGDRADYTVDVQKPLAVSVVAEGKNLDQCAPISLLIDGKTVEVISRSADKIGFGPVDLPAGTIPLSLAVADDAEAGTADGEVIKLTLTLVR